MTFNLLTHGLLVVLAAQASAIGNDGPVTVPRWSSYEMTLTATGRYDSPYVSVDLVGVFTGPNGEGIVAKGFWDGGQTFRIRFTPTVEGVWTFNTVSDDRGLDGHTGSLTCVKAAGGSHGFVRQAASNTRPWIYDDGTTVQGDRVRVTPQAPESVDPVALRDADRAVANALAAGRVAEVALFDRGETAIDESSLFRRVEYMAARYGAYPNVVWCVSTSAASERQRELWRTARALLTTLDPYFAGGIRLRGVATSCEPAS